MRRQERRNGNGPLQKSEPSASGPKSLHPEGGPVDRVMAFGLSSGTARGGFDTVPPAGNLCAPGSAIGSSRTRSGIVCGHMVVCNPRLHGRSPLRRPGVLQAQKQKPLVKGALDLVWIGGHTPGFSWIGGSLGHPRSRSDLHRTPLPGSLAPAVAKASLPAALAYPTRSGNPGGADQGKSAKSAKCAVSEQRQIRLNAANPRV